jgi:hypothetical protein
MIELYRILLDAVFCLLITSIMAWHPVLFDDFDYFKLRNNHFLECPCCQISSLDKKQRFISALRKVEVKKLQVNCHYESHSYAVNGSGSKEGSETTI